MLGRQFQISGQAYRALESENFEIMDTTPAGFQEDEEIIPIKQHDKGMAYKTESTDYNVAEFYERFHNCLPKVVKVTQGFHGETLEDMFDREQVMRLQAVSRQPRVIARMTRGNYTKLISIPLTFTEKLCVVTHHGPRKEMDLGAIVKEYRPPLTVQFPRDRQITVGNQSVCTNHIPYMTLLKTFEEMYLLGNFINDGLLTQEVVQIPLYLSQMRMAVVTGIVGQPDEKWAEYREELDRTCSSISYDPSFGNPNIAEYDPSAIHSDTTYCYVEPRKNSNFVRLVEMSPVRSFEHQMYNLENHQKQEEIPRLYEEIDNVARYLKTPATTFEPSPKQAHSGFTKELSSVLDTRITISDPNSLAGSHKSRYDQAALKRAVRPSVSPKPVRTVGPGLRPPTPPPRKQLPAIEKEPVNKNPFAVYSNDVPRGQINPTMNKEDYKTSTHAQRNTINCVQTTLTEVKGPEDVVKLSIEEVGEYLKKLNLDQFVDSFKTEMIDGVMLRELEKEMLINDLGMKSIEALRLVKFASTGHLPT